MNETSERAVTHYLKDASPPERPDGPIMVYQFGARAPFDDVGLPPVRRESSGKREPREERTTHTGAEHARFIMRTANRYYNELARIENRRRDAYDRITNAGEAAALRDQINAKGDEIEALARAEKARRVEARKRLPSLAAAKIKQLKAEIKDLKARRQHVVATQKTSTVQALIAWANGAADWAKKQARRATGLRHGTYLNVNMAHDRSAHDNKGRLGFRKVGGAGTIGEQFQVPMSIEEALGCKSERFRIELHPVLRDSNRARIRRKATVWMRVGSKPDEQGRVNRSAVWVCFHAYIHRLPPPGSVIRWVRYHRRLIADQERWLLDVTVSVPSSAVIRADLPGSVGIDLGWRKLPDGSIRVASLVATDGHAEELVVPATLVGRFEHADSLRSIQGKEFNKIKDDVCQFIRECPDAKVLLSGLQAQEDRGRHRSRGRDMTMGDILNWRSQDRMVRLWRYWSDHRVDGDDKIHEELTRWYHQRRHLWQWEANERMGAIAARREVFRLFGKRIAERYGTICFEELDLGKLKLNPKTEEGEKDKNEAANRNRQTTAVGTLRDAVVQALTKVGGKLVLVPAPMTTKTCNKCGAVCIWDQAARIRHTCQACKAEWDQDANAAANILAIGLEMDGEVLQARAQAKGGAMAKRKLQKKLSKESLQPIESNEDAA